MTHDNDNAVAIEPGTETSHGLVVGTVTHIDPMDAGRTLGVTVRGADGRDRYVAVPAGGTLAATVVSVHASGGRIEIAYVRPEHRRLGQPLGTVFHARAQRVAAAA